MFLVWIIHLLAIVAFVYVRRHASAEQLRPQWDALLTPKGRRTLAAVAEEVEVDAKLLNDAFLHALKNRDAGDKGEALRFLKLACRVIEWTTPRKQSRLKAMREFARMAAALLAVPPMCSNEFRLRRFVAFLAFTQWLHYCLVTGSQRFRLRLFVLGEGFKITLSSAKQSLTVLERDATAPAAWDEFTAASEDFKTLDRQHLEALRMLLEGRVAHQRAAMLAAAARAQ